MAAPLVARFGTKEVVSVGGPDAKVYLQGQLSQDLEPVAVGDSVLSLVLSPHGKVDAWIRVTRVDETTYWLDVDAGFGGQLAMRLNRFLLRTEATIVVTEVESVSFRALEDDRAALDALEANRLPDDHHLVLPALGWPQPGADAVGAASGLRAFVDRISEVSELDESGWQRLRICSGVPAMGTELVADTIPATAGIVDESVSFTKGCYTGQELVARIDSRGNRVPRSLCFGRAEAPVSAGAEIVGSDDQPIGTITSSAADPTPACPRQHVALGYVRRGIELPVDAVVAADYGAKAAISLRQARPSP